MLTDDQIEAIEIKHKPSNGPMSMMKFVRAIEAAVAAPLQAKIDALMLEYCPDEMTKAQLDNWAAHQQECVQAADENEVQAGTDRTTSGAIGQP